MSGTSGEMTGIRRAGIGLFVAQIVSWRTPGAGNAVNDARRVLCDTHRAGYMRKRG